MQNLWQTPIESWLKEDGLGEVEAYWQALPKHAVQARIKIKSDLVLAGLPWFCSVFEKLDSSVNLSATSLREFEGKKMLSGDVIELPVKLSWATAVTGERLALNLLHRASAIATATQALVSAAGAVKVLDTRKTTPGLRALEKYAVTVGGGHNHRFTQVDAWMIKDNHKELWGLAGAIDFFRSLKQPYKSLIVEIHSLEELRIARDKGVVHYLLDNFTADMLREACATKKPNEFYEVSGGVNLATIQQYLIPGVDAVSTSSITMFPPAVDISFKFAPVKS
jgi:nicotinate-nucleotide pyrophosphorylase (carboxylating)